ncbi:MAG: ThaI family type II restriction endonuclease [Chloroflexota bacterium]|jgi:hypothetical protein
MSNLITQLFTNSEYIEVIQRKLPPAFQTVEDELKGNPAVGLLREQIIIGMLIAFLGEANVKLIKGGVNPDIDCYVDLEPLSIKTVSLSGGLRLKWTSNAVKAKEFMNSYKPISDLLVIRIAWEKTGVIRYIPLDAQKHLFGRVGAARYLDYRGTTNTRGVNLSFEAEQALNQYSQSVSLPIFWKRSKLIRNPIDKWIDYWRGKYDIGA